MTTTLYSKRATAQALADRYDAGDRKVFLWTFASRLALLKFGLLFVRHALFGVNPIAPRGFNNALIGDGDTNYWTHLVERGQA